MKYVLVCASLLIASMASSQNWKPLNDSLTYYYSSGLYDKSILVGEKAVLAAKQEYGEKHQTYVLSLYNLAESYEANGQFDKAEKLFLLGLAIEKVLLGPDNLDYLGSVFNLANMYVAAAKYPDAEKFYLQVKEKFQVNPGEQTADYSYILNNLGELYKIIGQYDKAEPLILQSLATRKKLFGINHKAYNQTLALLSGLYQDMGDYKKSLPLTIQVLAFTAEAYGENTAIYAKRANNLAVLYHYIGDYQNARTYYLKAVRTVNGQSGEEASYASYMDNFAGLYQDLGIYDTAAMMYTQVLDMMRIAVGDDHPDYATVLNNFGGLYLVTGQYGLALQYFSESLAINQNVFGRKHSIVAGALHNIGQTHMRMGEYAKAEPVFLESTQIRKEVLGDEHPAYISSVSGLAGFYQFTGRYDKAEPLFLRAIAIRKQTLGETHPDYAISLNSLAETYVNMGQIDKAEKLLLDAIAIRKRLLGVSHPDYASSLKSLGAIYSNAGLYDKAEPYLIEAVNVARSSLGEQHIDFSNAIHELGLLYKNMNQPSKAEPLLIQSNEIWSKLLGKMHPYYSLGLHNLALVYDMKGEYHKAEQLLLRVKEINGKQMDHNSPNYAITLNTLAKVYMNLQQYAKTEPLFLERNRIIVKNLLDNFAVLSENEKGNYLLKIGDLLQENNSLLMHNKDASPAMKTNNFNQQLLFKSLTLSDSRNLLNAVKNSSNILVQSLFRKWQTNKATLAKQYSMPISNRMRDLENLETETELQEKELARISTAFRSQEEIGKTTQKEVRSNMAGDEVVIEFVRFRLFDKLWTDSILYAAYILTKNDSTPIFVPLFEESRLQNLIDSAGKNSATMADKFYRGIDIKNKGNSSMGVALYQLVWQPLEAHLAGIKKIVYSPSGKLHGIAFHALLIDSTTLLMDKYRLQQFGASRDIVNRSGNSREKPDSIVLFGDPSFSMDSLQLIKRKVGAQSVATTTYSITTRSNNRGTWAALTGTAQEVVSIQQLFNNSKGSTRLFTKTAANEENLKSLSGASPQILHLATHGFFLPVKEANHLSSSPGENNTYTLAADPLLRSGIILAGANYAWGGKVPIEGVEDGIATAYEISQLDLSNTELVVLSACETALGDVKGSEGVFGLQRAFKMAGVKKMIVSLWQVPDKETAELMTTFYTYWIKGKTINDAFTQAQADMRKKYSPFYWAAFVLVE